MASAGPTLLGVPVVFFMFGATLIGVMVLHHRSLEVALAGLALILTVRIGFSGFAAGAHLGHEWVKLVNLFGLLVGFALLADHFERSHLPDAFPRLLPRGAHGCFVLLASVWLLSGVLDNIAAAMVGAAAASRVFARRVHLGYLAAIVAAANAGGAGSVLGDTTTTMIWVSGISPLAVLPAYVGTSVALAVFGVLASRQQNRHARTHVRDPGAHPPVDRGRLAVVGAALAAMVCTNVAASATPWALGDRFPFLAAALWIVLIAGAPWRPPSWSLMRGAARGAVFLSALVLAASLMPVEALPRPTWRTTLGLGFVASVVDNIPLTKLALDQGGYDWALLAYSVGLGGSMLWFGSSAGVAIATLFPEAKSIRAWLRAGWHIPLGFLAGFLVQYAVRGWRP